MPTCMTSTTSFNPDAPGRDAGILRLKRAPAVTRGEAGISGRERTPGGARRDAVSAPSEAWIRAP
uniref:Uncharacterized protein n=3 Tax=environmental samples TaxID=48479 RepID=C7FPJ1_9BACT|nr:hypothetical protein [uncultured bacterium HF186_25m_30B18]ACU26470.1 hypothetical protein [uncultured bacterium HF186_25m_13D19]ACU26494.1 hypothetical protein [uncultured bacterium HF186_25m_27D22]